MLSSDRVRVKCPARQNNIFVELIQTLIYSCLPKTCHVMLNRYTGKERERKKAYNSCKVEKNHLSVKVNVYQKRDALACILCIFKSHTYIL